LKNRAWEPERESQRMKELLTGSRAETGGVKKQGRGDREREIRGGESNRPQAPEGGSAKEGLGAAQGEGGETDLQK